MLITCSSLTNVPLCGHKYETMYTLICKTQRLTRMNIQLILYNMVLHHGIATLYDGIIYQDNGNMPSCHGDKPVACCVK